MATNIPAGLNYVNIRRRQGVLTDFEIVFRNTMALDDFYLIDSFIQMQIKNFGQTVVNFQSEVYIMELLENRNTYNCSQFLLVPLFVNGVSYSGAAVPIPFSDIVGIYPNGSVSDIYATTDIIHKETPVKYTVNYSVYDLWYYIKNCQFPPNPYSGSGGALGGDSFLNL